MRTTVELPDTLMREVRIRAIHEGLKLKEMIALLLRRGLDYPHEIGRTEFSPRVSRNERTGLPVIVCAHVAPPGQELTAERVAEILLEQEVDRQREAR